MLKNILKLENTKVLKKEEQKSITGKGFALDLPIGIACRRGHQICCGSGPGRCGLTGGEWMGGRCFCFPS